MFLNTVWILLPHQIMLRFQPAYNVMSKIVSMFCHIHMFYLNHIEMLNCNLLFQGLNVILGPVVQAG